MKKLSLLLLFFLFGCGKLLESADNDPRFEPIKRQFEKDAAAFGLTINTNSIYIAFGDTRKPLKYAGLIPVTNDPGPSYGYCLVLGKTSNDLKKVLAKIALGNKNLEKRIIISDELKSFPIEDIEATVYHELGHCALGLGHNDKELIMNPKFNGNLNDFRYFMLEELFLRKRKMPRALTKISGPTNNMELLYEADYVFLSNHIYYQLYYDPIIDRYFYQNEIYSERTKTMTNDISAAASIR